VYKILEQALMGEASLPPVRSIDQLLPELGDMRHGARMFAARSRLHRLEGRALEAALDAVACVRLGADAQTQRIIVAGLAGLACEEFGLRELQQVLPLLDAGQVHITVVAFRGAIAERKTFPEVLEREAAAWKQAVKELYSRQLTTAQIVALLGDMSLQAAVASTEPSEVWHAVADYYAKMAEEASKPYWAQAPVPEPANSVARKFLTPFGKAGVRFAAADARVRTLLTALAGHSYRLNEGSLPARLDLLVPDYLDALPRDPFADAPLRSVTKQGHLVIYSVGPDGADDGGEDVGERLDPDATGDIVVIL